RAKLSGILKGPIDAGLVALRTPAVTPAAFKKSPTRGARTIAPSLPRIRVIAVRQVGGRRQHLCFAFPGGTGIRLSMKARSASSHQCTAAVAASTYLSRKCHGRRVAAGPDRGGRLLQFSGLAAQLARHPLQNLPW